MTTEEIKYPNLASQRELDVRKELSDMLENTPIPAHEVPFHLGLFVNRQLMARMLWMHELYLKVLHTPGVVMEFGVRWGQNLTLWQSFRAIYEPYNYTRKIIGFDTFEGFVGSNRDKDGTSHHVHEGAFNVTRGYEEYLERLMAYHEKEAPIPHMKKYELVKGDASITTEKYFQDNPETIVALAHFNMDIYQPTKDALEALKPRLVKGSVIAFDELVCPHYPGETRALADALGLRSYKMFRQPHNPYPVYLVIE